MKSKIQAALLFILIMALSCTKTNNVQQVIRDYEQNRNGVYTDLKLKFINFEQAEIIKVRDEIDYETQAIKIGLIPSEDSILDEIINVKKAILKNEAELKLAIEGNNVTFIDRKTEEINADRERLTFQKMVLEDEMIYGYSRIEKDLEALLKLFERDPDQILGFKYKATISIINPFLNNAKQSFTKTYILDPYKSKVMLSELIDDN